MAIMTAVLEQLQAGRSPTSLLGHFDAPKLASSVQLFDTWWESWVTKAWLIMAGYCVGATFGHLETSRQVCFFVGEFPPVCFAAKMLIDSMQQTAIQINICSAGCCAAL